MIPTNKPVINKPVTQQPARRAVRFELEIPQARSVSVAGSFNGWKANATPLNSLGGVKWTRELTLPPGRYEYRFVVDGRWLDDPKARAFAPNPYGGRNAVLEVRS
jgi:1,4-alpha-glucan branching enzyme